MENKSTVGTGTSDGATAKQDVQPSRRKRRGDEAKPRYFLPKPGSSLKNPELGQELVAEGDALVRSFQNNQNFYVLTVWKAVAEQNGGNPVIMKQVVDPKAE